MQNNFSEYIYQTYFIILITGIFSALAGYLGIVGICNDSKCMLCISPALYGIILLMNAASLTYICILYYHHLNGLNGSGFDPRVIVGSAKDLRIYGSAWIVTFFFGVVLSSGLATQWIRQEAPDN